MILHGKVIDQSFQVGVFTWILVKLLTMFHINCCCVNLRVMACQEAYLSGLSRTSPTGTTQLSLCWTVVFPGGYEYCQMFDINTWATNVLIVFK